MFKINDYVVYNAMGVYKVVDIRSEKDINDQETRYYILEPAFKDNLTIKIPVHNDKVLMRGVISKDDVFSVIEAMPKTETVWINNDRERSETFKAALRTGECEKLVKLIKSLYEVKEEKNYLGKKLHKKDEDIMKAAERNLYEEFAVALDIAPEDVLPFIKGRVS